ncbi:hypothetical protein [Micromonospora craniellae]|uniref:Glycerophosphoryl diester phosphodiesterase membrane domain-containing protein n=1 Tax=Micromonospora craniellae TaxID=2294034 RepID=A0A372FVZ0_9ACTN|nr:hypothetical protein [Micromonospora craniellae]QOC93549.1 hypothetical protein ID554_07890 [Micromonospora craniellae]RFS44972.1 hypothetical protein D0Q02_19120 [Micromonospora craniellae]
MPEAGPTAVLPGRPLTVGELLDSAVLLLRHHASTLLPLAAVLALGEQLLLLPLRTALGVGPPLWWLPNLNGLAGFWLLLALGAATEATIIVLLGNPAARAAGGALLGHHHTARRLMSPTGGRWGATLLLAVLVGAAMLFLSLLGPAWFLGWALLGAVAPALVLDRVTPPRALTRSASLASRVDGRAAALRVLGYLVWWIIRVGLGWGLFLGLSTLGLIEGEDALIVAATLLWAAVNTVAYAALACLDAVLHLETRIRTEGLDIRLSRVPADAAAATLAVRG